MGCFSKTCAKTHLPVLMHMAWGEDAPRLTEVVVLEKGCDPWRAEYDGYGLGRSVEDYDNAKFVLASEYEGERYEDLGASHDEPNQGYIHDEHFIRALNGFTGFKSFDAYQSGLDQFERGAEALERNLLTELDVAFLPGKAYRVVRALDALRDRTQSVTAGLFVETPLPGSRSIEELRIVADRFKEILGSRLDAVSAKVLAEA